VLLKNVKFGLIDDSWVLRIKLPHDKTVSGKGRTQKFYRCSKAVYDFVIVIVYILWKRGVFERTDLAEILQHPKKATFKPEAMELPLYPHVQFLAKEMGLSTNSDRLVVSSKPMPNHPVFESSNLLNTGSTKNLAETDDAYKGRFAGIAKKWLVFAIVAPRYPNT